MFSLGVWIRLNQGDLRDCVPSGKFLIIRTHDLTKGLGDFLSLMQSVLESLCGGTVTMSIYLTQDYHVQYMYHIYKHTCMTNTCEYIYSYITFPASISWSSILQINNILDYGRLLKNLATPSLRAKRKIFYIYIRGYI